MLQVAGVSVFADPNAVDAWDEPPGLHDVCGGAGDDQDDDVFAEVCK